MARSRGGERAASKSSTQSPLPSAPPLSDNNNNPDNFTGPDFKDQVRTVQLPAAAAHGSGKHKPKPAAFKHQEEEGEASALAPRDGQPQEPVALPVLGGNGQEATVVAFVPGIPVEEDTEASAGGGVANQQTTVLRKHMIWALAAVAVVVVVVVAVVVDQQQQ